MAKSRYCPNCGGEVSTDTQPRFCRHCGHSLTSNAREDERSQSTTSQERKQTQQSNVDNAGVSLINRKKCASCGTDWPNSYFAVQDICFDCFHKLPLEERRKLNPALIHSENSHLEVSIPHETAPARNNPVYSSRGLLLLVGIAAIIILLIMGYSAFFGHSKEFNSAMQIYETAQQGPDYLTAYNQFWQASASPRDHGLALAYLDSIREKLTLMNLNDSDFQVALNWADSLRNSPAAGPFRDFLRSDAKAYAGYGMWTTAMLYQLAALSIDPTNANTADSLEGYVSKESDQIVNSNGVPYNFDIVSVSLSTIQGCQAIDASSRTKFVSTTENELASYHLRRAMSLFKSGSYKEAATEAQMASRWNANPTEVEKLLKAIENDKYISFDQLAESFKNMTDVQQEQWNKEWDEQYFVKGTGTISDIKEAGFMDQVLSGISGDYYEIDLDIQNGYHAVLYFPQAGSQNWISKFYKGENISYKGRLKNLTDWGFWVTGYIVGE